MPGELGQALAATVYIAVAVALLYGTYWALAIRKALAGRIYRNHALWLGAFSIVVLAAVEPLAILVSSPSNPMVFALSFFPVSLATLVAFAFVDSTIPVARRSDPLLREILGWKKARVVTWSALLAILALAFSLGAAEGFSTSGTAFNVLFILPLPILALVGGPVLLVSARRSNDPLLRSSLKWMGIGFLSLIGAFVIGAAESALNLSYYYTTYSYGAVPWAAFFVLVGYSFYKSARSLAPINRLADVEPSQTEDAGAAPPA